jgi:hypothetical protein
MFLKWIYSLRGIKLVSIIRDGKVGPAMAYNISEYGIHKVNPIKYELSVLSEDLLLNIHNRFDIKIADQCEGDPT